jgi:hypothetical protein
MIGDLAPLPLEQSLEQEQLLEKSSGKKAALLAISVGGTIAGTLASISLQLASHSVFSWYGAPCSFRLRPLWH